MSLVELEAENVRLKKVIQRLQADIDASNNPPVDRRWDLELTEYRRYGRQLIMPEIGLDGASWGWIGGAAAD